MKDYSHIINHPHHISQTHPQMPPSARAAQFSAFAALTGYEDAVRETRRLTTERIILDDTVTEEINRILRDIEEHPTEQISITYFMPDLFKEGGEYVTVSGRIRRLDPVNKEVCMENGLTIPMDDIFDITGTGRISGNGD